MSGFELIDIARAIMGPECRVRDWASEAKENYHVAKAVHQAQRVLELWNTRAPDPSVAVLEAEVARLREALQPFADAAEHLHPVHPDNGMTLDGIRVSAWRAAWSALNPAPSEKEAG